MSEISDEPQPFKEVRHFISDIQEAIGIAFRDRKDELGNFHVAKIELNLHTMAERTTEGKLAFKIPVIGGFEAGLQDISSVTNELHLVIPHEKLKENTSTLTEVDTKESILEAVEAIKAAINELNDTPNNPYMLSEATINLKFATDKSGNITIPFLENAGEVAATQEVILLVKKLEG